MRLRSVFHTENEISRIMESTGGWTFAVDRYVSHLATCSPPAHYASAFDSSECFSLLGNEWFFNYPAQTK